MPMSLLAPAPSDPIASFRACHDRIRTFTDGLARMAALPDLADPRVPTAAAQAWRYFKEGLPLHAKDEDESLGPRLVRVAPDSGRLLEELAADHVAIDVTLETLLPLLETLARGEQVPLATFRIAVAALTDILIPHIVREEAELFPLCTVLSPEDKRAIARELHERRR